MSEFISVCPKCRQQILCDTEYVGRRVACPVCMQEIIMPSPPQQQHLVQSAPTPPSGGTTGTKKSPTMLYGIIIGAVVVLAAGGGAFFAFHGASEKSPVPVAMTPAPAPIAPQRTPAQPVESAPKSPARPSRAGDEVAFYLKTGHVILNKNGYMEAFNVDPSTGNLQHKSNTGAGTAWGSWSKVGNMGGLTGRPAAVCGPNGAVDVFVLNKDNSIVHFSRASFTDHWTESSLGGNLASEPTAIVNANHNLEVFATESDGSLAYNWSTDGGNSWAGWSTMGSGCKGRPAAIARNDGGAEVFVRRVDNAMEHYAHHDFDSKWNDTSLYGGNFASDPWVVQASDGHMEAFCIRSNGTLWHNANKGTGTPWGGWNQLNTGVSLLTSDLFATVNQNGDTEVFARQASNGNTGYMVEMDNSWSHWQTVQGSLE